MSRVLAFRNYMLVVNWEKENYYKKLMMNEKKMKKKRQETKLYHNHKVLADYLNHQNH